MLKRAGIAFTVIEKNAGRRHVARDALPGRTRDNPSRGYTHIFGAQFPYSRPFCDRAENQRYFHWVADTYELRDDIVFETEVRALTWDETVDLGDRDRRAGRRSSLRSNAVVTAVGFLNRPRLPEIEGMAEFTAAPGTRPGGRRASTLSKRFAVVGTGCTGYQLLPEPPARRSAWSVQRTPQWMFGVPGYLSTFPPEVRGSTATSPSTRTSCASGLGPGRRSGA